MWKESGSLNGVKTAAVSTAQAGGKAGRSTGQLWNKVETPILIIQGEKN